MERCLSNDLNTIEANITNLQISITALSAFSTSAMISAYARRNTTDNTASAFVRIRSDKALSAGTAIYIFLVGLRLHMFNLIILNIKSNNVVFK